MQVLAVELFKGGLKVIFIYIFFKSDIYLGEGGLSVVKCFKILLCTEA